MTLKAYKDAVRVGVRMRVLTHWIDKYVGDVRTVVKVQGNAFVVNVPGRDKPDGTPERLWSDFPKAAQLQFDGRVASVRLDEQRFFSVEFIGDAP